MALYAVCEMDSPLRVRVFEIYRDFDAYKSYLETAFQAIQGNDREDGQIAQASPDDADCAWCQDRMSGT